MAMAEAYSYDLILPDIGSLSLDGGQLLLWYCFAYRPAKLY